MSFLDRTPAEKRYAETFGDDALERQRELAKGFWVCCARQAGGGKPGPHHQACKNFVPDEQPDVIDGQESLL